MAATDTDPTVEFGDAGPTTDIPTITATAVMALDFARYGEADVAAHRHGQIQEAVQVALTEAGLSPGGFPLTLTPDLLEVLGMMIFTTAPMAHAFRDAGRAEIPRKCEDEQAFILHWLATLVLEHGPDWRRHAGETRDAVIAEARTALAKREAERAARDAARASRG